jgi:sensor histidine kinase YesM
LQENGNDVIMDAEGGDTLALRLRRLAERLDARRYLEARVFLLGCGSVFLVSALLVTAYAAYAVRMDVARALAHGSAVAEALAGQADALADVCAATHALALSSDHVYKYAKGDAASMPSYEWFTVYQKALETLTLCARGQSGTALGMALCRNGVTPLLCGGFYAPPATMMAGLDGDGLRCVGSHFVYVTVLDADVGLLLVTQVADQAMDQILENSRQGSGVVRILDADGALLRAYPPEASMGQANARMLRASAASLKTGWTFEAVYPLASTAQSLRQIAPWLLCVLMFSLAAGLGLSYGASRRLARGLRVMRENARRVEEERYGDVVRIDTMDELGMLSSAFEHMTARIATQAEEIRSRARKEQELAMQVLRAQVSPHFLYNTLNTLRNLAVMNGSEHIARLALALTRLLRATLLDESRPATLADELASVRDYLEIGQYQTLREPVLSIAVDAEVQACLMPRMTLQPIVENAVIHGFPESFQRRECHIRIDARVRHGILTVRVTDNGQGMEDSLLASILERMENTDRMRFSRIGIRNVHERIRMRHGDAYGLALVSKRWRYTQVSIRLPVITAQEDGEWEARA